MQQRVLKKFVCAIVFLSTLTNGYGQTKEKDDNIKFGSINGVGIMEGEASTSITLQTINGIKYKSWFGGIGTGLDYYVFRSIPVFVDVRKQILPNGPPLFAYVDAGVNFTWMKSNSSWFKTNYENGLYYDVGISYNFPLKDKYVLILSGGYSQKYTNEVRHMPVYCITQPCPERIESYNYVLRRIALKAGVAF